MFEKIALAYLDMTDYFEIYRASDYPREYDGATLQMRLSYSPCAHIFLFLVQWTDCHFAGALGLLRILIYKVNFPFFLVVLSVSFLGYESCHMMFMQAYEDGKTSMYIHERKASIKQFYGASTWKFLFSLLKLRHRAFQFL